MTWNKALAYRMAAAEGSTHIEMLILVYDNIAADLLRASSAAHAKDIGGRCASSNHALLLLGHLEAWIEFEDSDSLAQSLRQFYSMLRSRILQSQKTNDAAELERLAAWVSGTREVWQAKEKSARASRASKLAESTGTPQPGQSAPSFSAHA